MGANVAAPAASGIPSTHDPRRPRVLSHARAMLTGAPVIADGVSFPGDQVGFVRAAFWAVGIDLFDRDIAADATADSLQILYRTAAARQWLHAESPRPGDLVFFDPNDRGNALYPAQVAIVETIATDGTFTALGSFRNGPDRITLNLRTPDIQTASDGRRLNDLLAGDSTLTAAQLFRSFANPLAP